MHLYLAKKYFIGAIGEPPFFILSLFVSRILYAAFTP